MHKNKYVFAQLTQFLDRSKFNCIVAKCQGDRYIKSFFCWNQLNAVRIQIYCAIITYCLVVIVKHDMKLERSVYEILQIVGISLTDKTHLRDLFDKSNINNVNERFDSSEPSLFNF